MKSRLEKITNWQELAHSVKYDSRGLAAKCNVCLRQMERYFDKKWGKSPRQWLNETRLARAPSLLRSDLSVKEVSHMLGYKQPFHFSRQYKAYHGVPPSITRNKFESAIKGMDERREHKLPTELSKPSTVSARVGLVSLGIWFAGLQPLFEQLT